MTSCPAFSLCMVLIADLTSSSGWQAWTAPVMTSRTGISEASRFLVAAAMHRSWTLPIRHKMQFEFRSRVT